MPNSVERSSKSKKNKLDNFIWSDDEVELLLNVVLEYKTARTMENVDWETCQTKYTDILDLFRAQYPSKENAEEIGKEFPHESEEINKAILTNKLKAIRIKFRAAVDRGRKSGHGRVVLLYFDKCEEIWGGSPATTTLPTGIETSQMQEDVDRLSPGLACSSPANSSIPNTPSTSRPSTPSSSRPSTPSTCNQTNTPSTSRPSTPSTFDTVDGNNSPDHDKDKENTQPSQATSVKDRRELLNSQLKNYKQERLKRKLSTDAQLLQVVQEDVAIKKRLLEKMEDVDRQQSLQMNKFTTNMEQLTGSIVEGFAMLRQVMVQPTPIASPFSTPLSGYNTWNRQINAQPVNMENNTIQYSQYTPDNF